MTPALRLYDRGGKVEVLHCICHTLGSLKLDTDTEFEQDWMEGEAKLGCSLTKRRPVFGSFAVKTAHQSVCIGLSAQALVAWASQLCATGMGPEGQTARGHTPRCWCPEQNFILG